MTIKLIYDDFFDRYVLRGTWIINPHTDEIRQVDPDLVKDALRAQSYQPPKGWYEIYHKNGENYSVEICPQCRGEYASGKFPQNNGFSVCRCGWVSAGIGNIQDFETRTTIEQCGYYKDGRFIAIQFEQKEATNE
jgi:hypothetical protein